MKCRAGALTRHCGQHIKTDCRGYIVKSVQIRGERI
jgi:hypothetical protein